MTIVNDAGGLTPITKKEKQKRRREALYGATHNRLDRVIAAVAPQWGVKRMLARVALSGYQAATERRIRRKSTGILGGSADDQVGDMDLYSLREQSREAERNDAIAGGILGRCVDNVIGPYGLMPQAQTDDNGWNTAAEEWWTEWSRRPSDPQSTAHAEVTGQLSMTQVQRIAFRSLLRDGDIGFVLTDEGQIQGVEADRIATPVRRPKLADGHKIVNGVHLDKIGRPIEYFVGERLGRATVYTLKAEPVEARNFILLKAPKRFSQTRGVPIFHALLEHFDQLGHYIEAELVGAKVSAMLTAFVTQRDAAVAAYQRAAAGEDNEGSPVNYERLESGLIMYGEPGEGVDIIAGNRPNANFPDFVVLLLRILGINLGLPLELVALDFSKTNYSSARAALLQAYRTFRGYQALLVDDFLTRLWRWRIGRAISLKNLTQVKKALEVRWLAPGWPWVDPLDEIRADALAVDRGFKSLIDVNSEQGRDWEVTLRANARVYKRALEIAEQEDVPIEYILRPGSQAPEAPGAGSEKQKEA